MTNNLKIVIQGQIGGRTQSQRFLLEISSIAVELGLSLRVLPMGSITGAVPQDLRSRLLQTFIEFKDNANDSAVDCWVSAGPDPPPNAARRIWIPPSNSIIGETCPGDLEIYPGTTCLPLGINPVRFYPGVIPIPLPLLHGRAVYLYRGPLKGAMYETLCAGFQNLPMDQALFIANDYGYESDTADDSVTRAHPKNCLIFRNITDERQLAGLYATAAYLIHCDPLPALAVFEALACGVPVLTLNSSALPGDWWSSLSLQVSNDTDFETIIATSLGNHEPSKKHVAEACHRIQLEFNWLQVTRRFLKLLPEK